MFLTLAPLISGLPRFTVRLACLIHAASVRSEPESNSPNKNVKQPKLLSYFCPSKVDCCFQCLIYFSVFLRSHCLPTTISILLSQSDWAHRTIQFFKEHPVHTAQNSPSESFLHFHEKWTSLGFSYQCTGLILSFISVSQFSLRQIGNSFQNQHRKPYRFAFINVSVDEFLIYT